MTTGIMGVIIIEMITRGITGMAGGKITGTITVMPGLYLIVNLTR
jgi:hypothetical protein